MPTQNHDLTPGGLITTEGNSADEKGTTVSNCDGRGAACTNEVVKVDDGVQLW